MKPGSELSPVDLDIEEVVRCLSPRARDTLISLLGELFTVLENTQELCAATAPACQEFTEFSRLRRLLRTLNGVWG